MGIALLRDILGDGSSYELDDSIYVPAGSVPTLDLEVSVLPFDQQSLPGKELTDRWC